MSPRQPLDLRNLRPPRACECLLWGKGVLLGVVIPVWVAVHLAVTPQAGRSDPAPRGNVAGIAVEGRQLAALRQTFNRHAYDLDAVANGERRVPPIFVRSLPQDLKELQVKARKKAFVKMALPLILKANARIRAERARLLDLIAAADGDPAALPDSQKGWLRDLASRYRSEWDDLAALKRRVDVVPVSLALAQAAHESAWGTSRFARQGNALFGQWTWDTDQGIRPKDPQADKGDYAVRAFNGLDGSVAAYMNNLNSHPAYAGFRARRARMRKAGRDLDAVALAGGLVRYSQRGEAYVADIRETIRHNDFQRFDDVRLGPAPLG